MHLSGLYSIAASFVLHLALIGCASTSSIEAPSGAQSSDVGSYGLRAPQSQELLPDDIEMQWNNLQLRSACAILTKAERELDMIMWEALVWTRVTNDESCHKLLTAKAEGQKLANRAMDEGRSDELIKMCRRTERRVGKLVGQRLQQGRLAGDFLEGTDRLAECANIAKE